MTTFTESELEDAALEWLEGLGWKVAHGPGIAPHAASAERTEYGEVILERRLRDALDRLNPDLPAEALEDAFRKLTRPEGSTLEARNRAFHRMLVDGVTVEYRSAGGAMRGAQVSVLDYENPAKNDWLAVNQFTVVEGEHERRPDVVLFVNGLPLGLVELKNPANEKARSGRPGTRSRPTRPNSRTCSPSTRRSSLRTESRRASARSLRDGNGSSLGARSRARRWPIRICRNCRSSSPVLARRSVSCP